MLGGKGWERGKLRGKTSRSRILKIPLTFYYFTQKRRFVKVFFPQNVLFFPQDFLIQ